MRKLNLILFIFVVQIIFSVQLTGCAKEYSIEGLVAPVNDTVIIPVIVKDIPSCNLCDASSGITLSTWSFQIGNSMLCGMIDTAIVSPQRTAFTFYGPSSCSVDSGMVISVYLPNDTLNKDRQNIVLERNAFYYYDRVTPSDILVSRQNVTFTVIIDQYTHQTRIATGRFEGSVFKPTGGGTRITSGKFHVKLL